MEGKIVYFEKPGADNTEDVLRIVKKRAGELGIKTVVVATTVGSTALRATQVLKGMKVVAVTHSAGFKAPNTQEVTEENYKKIVKNGGVVFTATHLFSGVSAAWRRQFNTYVIGDIVANTLRILGQGMKVTVEIAVMVADAGLVRTDEDIIVVAGTGRGADYAVVLRPVNSNAFFDLRVKEILCKPHF
ncbi:MAG: hypothetical protein JW856_04735 [Dehalococcoidales bacterium]|nr:hypothetical protein [Dehalococcoidales bacterium]